MKYFCTTLEAVNEIKQGKMLVVVDHPERENQGDLILSSHAVTDKKINFMLKHARGLICAPITKIQIHQFDLSLMVAPDENTEKTRVNFTVSVDAKNVSSFGVSAKDKALTIKTLANPKARPDSLVRPGHIFPLLSVDDGLGERQGHTEATIELLRLANLPLVGILCEILAENGSVASMADLIKFAKKFNLKMVAIADLINQSLVVKKAASLLPTKYGLFEIIVYKSIDEDSEHVVLKSKKSKGDTPFVRLHSKCLTGDTFGSLRCDCGDQLAGSMKAVAREGGLILYLNQEGRGIGLTDKIHAYCLQDQGIDTVEANLQMGLPIDARDYCVAAEILKDLGISRIRLLTNNPQKIKGLQGYGINVVSRVSLEVSPNKINSSYLLAKKYKLGHKLTKV